VAVVDRSEDVMIIGVIVFGAAIFFVLAQFMDGRIAGLLGLAFIVVAGVAWRRRQARRMVVDEFGLTDEEAHQLQEHARQGDREASLKLIADAQERQRAEFQATTGVDVKGITPEIGRDIAWADIVNHAFRILGWQRDEAKDGTGDSASAVNQSTSYGNLLVESPILNQKVRLPIQHRDDYRLFASVYDEPSLANLLGGEEAEFLVAYAPDRPEGSPLHALHYAVVPPGTLDSYYSENEDAHMARPNPWELFGPFVYEGKMQVRVSPELNVRVPHLHAPASTESRLEYLEPMRSDGQWSVVEGEPCRVTEFIPLGSTVTDGKVQAHNSTYPYASIILECRKIAGTATGYVTHKVDFANLWAAFKDRGVFEDEEVIIIWSKKRYKPPYRLAKLAMPRMWVMVCPKGAFEMMTDEGCRPDLDGAERWNAMKPIVDWKPDVME